MKRVFIIPIDKMNQRVSFEFNANNNKHLVEFMYNNQSDRIIFSISSSGKRVLSGKVVQTEYPYITNQGFAVIFKNKSRSEFYPNLENISTIRFEVNDS